MDFEKINASFRKQPVTKKFGEIELEFIPLSSSQRISLAQYAKQNGSDVTTVQAMVIVAGCTSLDDSHLEQVKNWDNDLLSDMSDFVTLLSGSDAEAGEEARKNS